MKKYFAECDDLRVTDANIKGECDAVYLASEVDARISRLKQICYAAYQLAGTVGAPGRFLDALALYEDADVEKLLPVTLDECSELARVAELEKALRGIMGYFTSGNAIPVERATIKADSPEIVFAKSVL